MRGRARRPVHSLIAVGGLLLLTVVAGAASGPAAGAPGYGTHMIEVGYRFAVAGRAAESQNFELTDYQLEELGESLARVRATPAPRDLPRGAHLGSLLDTFAREPLASLRRAAAAK